MRVDINEKRVFQEETNETSKGNNLSYDQMKERVMGLWTAVCAITDRGNNAEVKRKKDGSLTVYEVKKNIITVR